MDYGATVDIPEDAFSSREYGDLAALNWIGWKVLEIMYWKISTFLQVSHQAIFDLFILPSLGFLQGRKTCFSFPSNIMLSVCNLIRLSLTLYLPFLLTLYFPLAGDYSFFSAISVRLSGNNLLINLFILSIWHHLKYFLIMNIIADI